MTNTAFLSSLSIHSSTFNRNSLVTRNPRTTAKRPRSHQPYQHPQRLQRFTRGQDRRNNQRTSHSTRACQNNGSDSGNGKSEGNGESLSSINIQNGIASWKSFYEDFDRDLLAITSAYFVQGALGISRLAISFFMKDDLHLSPATSAALTGIAIIPWLIKPVYGAISDIFPIYNLRRKPYLIIASITGTLSWLSLASIVNDVPGVVLATVCASFSVAFTDVVVDSLVVEKSRNVSTAKAGELQSLCWGISAVGGLLTAYLSGSLIEHFGTRGIFLITSFLPLLTGILSYIYINEQPLIPSDKIVSESTDNGNGSSNNNKLMNTFKTKFIDLFNVLKLKSVYLPTLFIFLWQSTPNAESALFYFQTNVLNFGPEFLGSVRLTCSIASLLGILLYNLYLKQLPIKSIMKWSSIISVPLSLTQVLLVTRWNLELGIPDKMFALVDSAVLTVLGQVAFMPTLVLAARISPVGVEAIFFASLMSIYNASGATSNELGALSMYLMHVTEQDFSNLPLLVTLCSFGNILPLPLLSLLDNVPSTDNKDGDAMTSSTTDEVLRYGKDEEMDLSLETNDTTLSSKIEFKESNLSNNSSSENR